MCSWSKILFSPYLNHVWWSLFFSVSLRKILSHDFWRNDLFGSWDAIQIACVCLPFQGCLNFFLICFSAWLSNQHRFSANFWITIYFYPNTKLCIKNAGTILATTMFLDWYYSKTWCQDGVKNKTLFSSAKYQWGLSSLKQVFQTLEAQISYEGFFYFSTRRENRSKFKSPGVQTAPWLHWIWSESTVGLKPKATSWVKFLWTQLELPIKTKLTNVAHCRLQLDHLHFSQCLSNYCLNYSATLLSISPSLPFSFSPDTQYCLCAVLSLYSQLSPTQGGPWSALQTLRK